jgi:hypothetical protein
LGNHISIVINSETNFHLLYELFVLYSKLADNEGDCRCLLNGD